jgi:hypothetical protein
VPIQAGAIFDSTGRYRYWLWREWRADAPRVGFVMLNPSRADASVDDPTIRRCIRFAQGWGFGRLDVMNLFAYCTAHPQELRCATEPIGHENDAYLVTLSSQVDSLILAWGNGGQWQGRDRQVLRLFADVALSPQCLGQTQQQHPKHPLYLKTTTLPQPYDGGIGV